MIRDPSDGSVRAPRTNADKSGQSANVQKSPVASSGADTTGDTPVIETTTSGLPDAAGKDADRHERSRQWLKEYRAGKIKPKPPDEPTEADRQAVWDKVAESFARIGTKPD